MLLKIVPRLRWRTSRTFSVRPVWNYAEEKANFRIEVPERYNFVGDTLPQWLAGEKPETHPALWWVNHDGQEKKFSFADLLSQSSQLQSALALPPGSRCLLVLPRIPEFWLASLAAIRGNIVFCPATTQLSARDLRSRIRVANIDSVITDSASRQKVDEAIEGTDTVKRRFCVTYSEDERLPAPWSSFNELYNYSGSSAAIEDTHKSDLMAIYFTSGTTGDPKMVGLPHAHPMGHLPTSKYWLAANRTSLIWSVSDTGWVKVPYAGMFGPWVSGAGAFVYNPPPALSPAGLLDVLKRYPITTFCCPPTLYKMFIQEKMPTPDELPHLRDCGSGGEANAHEVIMTWQDATGFRIREGYGQTETVMLTCNMPGHEYRRGSMGRATPGLHSDVVDDEGRAVPVGEEGHLAWRCDPRPDVMFLGYLGSQSANDAAFHHGWYFTGDRVYKDEDGFLYFVGRSDDVIKSSGYRIGPTEVESALQEHPAVAECAVVASPDPLRGSVVKAFIILAQTHLTADQTALAKELEAHVRSITAPYKRPRVVEFVTEMPRTVTGKIQRAVLRRAEEAKAAGGNV